MKKETLFFVCLFFLLLLGLLALFPGLITPFSFEEQKSNTILEGPGLTHWLGTDELGRDLLARILYGARISLACALLSTLLSGLLGIVYGSLSALSGGWFDHLLMRIVDVLYSIPDLLLFILIGLFLGRDFWGLLITLSSLGWVDVARITRGEILKYREMPYVTGAQAIGVGQWRILARYLFPQARPAISVTLIFRIPAVILAESTLSFIGLGLQPPYSSWGTLASEGYSAFRFYPHLILFPSLTIFLTVFALNQLGQRLSRSS